MSRIHGLLDPEARATLEAVFAKWAAPGMCNPEDEVPCVDGEPSEEAERGDMRSQGQRHHDALKAMGRSVLASGELGNHNGLPCTMIVHNAAGPRVRRGRCGYRRREPPTDERRHPAGVTLAPLPLYLRQAHQRAAVSGPEVNAWHRQDSGSSSTH
jgi:Domain of unknown function (DUF222)